MADDLVSYTNPMSRGRIVRWMLEEVGELRSGIVEPRPAFTAYWQRLSDRPAAARAREIDDALLARQHAAGETT